MPRSTWDHLVNVFVASLLLGAGATLWQANSTLAVHGEKIQTLEKRVDRLEI